MQATLIAAAAHLEMVLPADDVLRELGVRLRDVRSVSCRRFRTCARTCVRDPRRGDAAVADRAADGCVDGWRTLRRGPPVYSANTVDPEIEPADMDEQPFENIAVTAQVGQRCGPSSARCHTAGPPCLSSVRFVALSARPSQSRRGYCETRLVPRAARREWRCGRGIIRPVNTLPVIPL
jgi:hypothetical protein